MPLHKGKCAMVHISASCDDKENEWKNTTDITGLFKYQQGDEDCIAPTLSSDERSLKVMDVRCNVLRHSKLSEPKQWADGDYTAILADGSERDATYEEYLASIGLPSIPSSKD